MRGAALCFISDTHADSNEYGPLLHPWLRLRPQTEADNRRDCSHHSSEASSPYSRGAVLLNGLRTTRHVGHQLSQTIRKPIEEVFGLGKTVGPMRKTKPRGVARVGFEMLLTVTGFNLAGMRYSIVT